MKNHTTPNVSVVIVTYKGTEYVGPLFTSLSQQTFQAKEIIVIDNSPTNETAELVQKTAPTASVYHQSQNLDFSRGYNEGMRQASGEFILILNQDMTLKPDAIEQLVASIDSDEKIGAVAPKLLRLSPAHAEGRVIDSMGIRGNYSRHFWNIGEGEADTHQYDSNTSPFGVSGAAILFRKSALEDIAQHGGGGPTEYFDAQFIAYKEDIDLSYRLRHRAWKIAVAPNAIVYHKRTAQELKKSEGLRIDRQAKTFRIRGNSLRNQWWFLLKNESCWNLFAASPAVVGVELAKLFFLAVFEPSTLKIIPSAVQGLPTILKKRRAILTSSKISGKELRRFIRA